jgi:hypothetical protein
MKIQELDGVPPSRPARPHPDDADKPDGPEATRHRVVVPIGTPPPARSAPSPAGPAPAPFPARPPARKDRP